MRPARKLACAVLALAVVTSVVYATGAFTSTTAERSADVEVAGYGSAFLSLQPSDGPNGAFASYGANGALQVSIGGARTGGTGVNPDSQTAFQDVFTITNKGSQPVSVWLIGGSPAVTFVGPDGRSIEGKSGAVTLMPGGRSLHVGLAIDARGVKPGTDLLQSVEIRTDAGVTGELAASANEEDTATSVTSSASTEGEDSSGRSPVESESETESTADGSSGDGSSDSTADDSDSDESSRDGGGNGGDVDESTDSRRPSDNGPVPWTRPRSNTESDDESDDLSNAEKAVAFGAGGAGGGLFAFAMPDNWVGSPFYLLGQVIASLIPGPIGVIKDAQALLNSILDGDLAGIVLNGVALIPGLGSIAEGSQILKTISKWADTFPTSTDDALDLFMPLIKHMPGSVSMTVMANFADGPMKSLRKGGMSADDILKYKQKGFDLRQIENLRHRGVSPSVISKYVDEGYSPRQISLMTDSGFKPDDLKEFLDEGYDFGKIYKLHNKGIPKEDIRKYVDEGISLRRISDLREKGIPANDIQRYVDEGVSLQRVADLRNSGFSAANIRRYVGEGIDLSRIKRLRRQDVSPDAISTAVRKDRDLERISKYRHMGIPVGDISYYVTTGKYRFRLAGFLRNRLGRSPEEIRDVIEKVNPKDLTLASAGLYNQVNGWCHDRPKAAEDSYICQQLPTGPPQEQQSENESGSTQNSQNRSERLVSRTATFNLHQS